MAREIIQSLISGEVVVVDVDAGLCSDTLHYNDREAPLDEYHLDDELSDDFDIAQWRVYCRR